MNILILENNKQIKDKYLGYLSKSHNLYKFWDFYDDDSIDILIIRSW
jgi:hypothetical protein